MIPSPPLPRAFVILHRQLRAFVIIIGNMEEERFCDLLFELCILHLMLFKLPRSKFSIVCDGVRLSRPPDVLQLQDDLQKFRILSGTSKNSERRPSVTLYTDECTGDQQSLQNINIAAVKFYNGGNATHVLQFSLVCSNATTTLALMDPEAVSRPTMTRDDALKVLVKTKFVCYIYSFIISVLALFSKYNAQNLMMFSLDCIH